MTHSQTRFFCLMPLVPGKQRLPSSGNTGRVRAGPFHHIPAGTSETLGISVGLVGCSLGLGLLFLHLM